MNIYTFNEVTKEYTGVQKAESDPEATKQAGKFVAWIPAYTTVQKPPKVAKNRVAVFIGDKWRVKVDYRHNFFGVDDDLTVYPIDNIGEQPRIMVNKQLAEKIRENKDNYKIVENTVVEKTAKEKMKEKEQLFDELFFYTSLGYVRRKVTFDNGSQKDFLTDILPILEVNAPYLITYEKPDFSKNDIPTQHRDVVVTEQFIKECKEQIIKDFFGV